MTLYPNKVVFWVFSRHLSRGQHYSTQYMYPGCINASILIVVLYYSFVRSDYWGKLGKGYVVSLWGYNFMCIYNYLRIKHLIQKVIYSLFLGIIQWVYFQSTSLATLLETDDLSLPPIMNFFSIVILWIYKYKNISDLPTKMHQFHFFVCFIKSWKVQTFFYDPVKRTKYI